MFRIEEFVRESNAIEGIDSVTAAQVGAHMRLLSYEVVTVESLCELVNVLQPNAYLREFPEAKITRVASHIAPASGPRVRERLAEILKIADPWMQHVAYEDLHPFTDGNGRSGRALWLHALGGSAPLGFLHSFYYQTLSRVRLKGVTNNANT